MYNHIEVLRHIIPIYSVYEITGRSIYVRYEVTVPSTQIYNSLHRVKYIHYIHSLNRLKLLFRIHSNFRYHRRYYYLFFEI